MLFRIDCDELEYAERVAKAGCSYLIPRFGALRMSTPDDS